MVSKLIYLLLCWILHLFWILIWKIFVFFQSFVIWCTQNIFSWVTPLIKGQVKTNAKNKYKTKSLSSFFSSILLCDEIRQVLLLQKKDKTKKLMFFSSSFVMNSDKFCYCRKKQNKNFCFFLSDKLLSIIPCVETQGGPTFQPISPDVFLELQILQWCLATQRLQ